MLTKQDFIQLEKKFVTKKEFYSTTGQLVELIKTTAEELKRELKEDIIQFKDDILHEIVSLREDKQKQKLLMKMGQ